MIKIKLTILMFVCTSILAYKPRSQDSYPEKADNRIPIQLQKKSCGNEILPFGQSTPEEFFPIIRNQNNRNIEILINYHLIYVSGDSIYMNVTVDNQHYPHCMWDIRDYDNNTFLFYPGFEFEIPGHSYSRGGILPPGDYGLFLYDEFGTGGISATVTTSDGTVLASVDQGTWEYYTFLNFTAPEGNFNDGLLTMEVIEQQTAVLNSVYNQFGYSFTTASVDSAMNAGWYYATDSHKFETDQWENDDQYLNMAQVMTIDVTTSINYYWTGARLTSGLGVFPWSFPEDDNRHGLFCGNYTIPGGESGWTEGYTGVHEVGHYLGLYHIFENGCTMPGDYVDDTPDQEEANFGCPSSNYSCESNDNIGNYMDYVDDNCMTHFTQGQKERIDWAIVTYRPALISDPAPNIIINEIMKNPGAVSDSDGEWFELYNASDDTVDISGWTFRDVDSDSLTLDANCCINIPPNEYFVLICNGDSATNGGIVNYDLLYDRDVFNLGNSEDEIIILDNYGREVDRVQYDNGTNFPDPNGISMELIYHNLDNNVGSNWEESTNMLPSGDYGTPGQGNSTLLPALATDIDTDCHGGVNNGWMDLGIIEINDTSECMLIVSNAGYSDLILSNIHIGEINDNPNTAFSVTIDSLQLELPAEALLVIPPEGSDSIIVHFAPEEAGFYSGNLSFDTNDENMPTHNEPVYATGLSPVREIYIETDFDSDTIYFYNAQIDDNSNFESINIFNLGNTPLEIDDIIATEPFHVGIITDGSLEPVETLEVPVQFYPDSIGDYSGTVTIYSNDSDEGEVVIHLYGESEVLSIDEIPIPETFTLYQNHPNPFNPVTTLRYDLPEDALVNITIYDMMGRVVKTLVNSQQKAGFKSVLWNATNDKGQPVSAGLYLNTIQAGDFRQTKKMVLLK